MWSWGPGTLWLELSIVSDLLLFFDRRITDSLCLGRSVVVLFPICYWRISLLHRPAACLYYSFTYPIQKNDSDSMTSYQICYLENWKTDYGTRTGLGSGTGSSAGYRSRSEGSGFGSLGGYGSETGGSRNGSTAYGSRSAAGGYGFITG